MVEYAPALDKIFACLADRTRRDILNRLQLGELNVTEIAQPYDVSLASISKHLHVLERANMIRKRRAGKERIVSLAPDALLRANEYLRQYEHSWNERFDTLEITLEADRQ